MTHPDVLTHIDLPPHPDPDDLAHQLETLARTLRAHGNRRLDLARALAATGYPSNTLGTGARSSDPTSTTEREALTDRPNRFAHIDQVYAHRLTDLARACRELSQVDALVAQHAADIDPIPAGSGECQACGKVVRHNPLKRDNDRLRAGLCRSDYDRWDRHRKANPTAHQPDWIRFRRRELGLPERIILGSTA